MALTVAVVGCGAVAQRLYLQPLQQLEKRHLARVVALVDPHLGQARSMQTTFPRATIHAELSDLWSQNSPDLTLVLSPAHLHAAHSIAALEHQSHVLCEKPMAASVGDCDQMVGSARRNSRVLAVGMVRRYFPSFAHLAELIRSGQLGSIDSFEYREGKRFDWEVTTPAAFQRRGLGGTGVLFDIGPHAIDALSWLFGTLRVAAYEDDALLSGVEANVVMELQASACGGRVHLSWDSPLANELRVYGSKGEAVLRLDSLSKLAISFGGRFSEVDPGVSFPADVERPSRLQVRPTHYAQAIHCQLVQVIRAIQLREIPAVDGDMGRQCVSLMERALAMAEPMDMPWLSSKHRTAYQALHWTGKR